MLTALTKNGSIRFAAGSKRPRLALLQLRSDSLQSFVSLEGSLALRLSQARGISRRFAEAAGELQALTILAQLARPVKPSLVVD